MRKIAFVAAALVLLSAGCSSNGSAEQALELSAGTGDAMASCLAFDPAVLAQMPVAFAGTATEVSGDRVNLTVTRWFKGGDTDQVVVVAPRGLEALIGGIRFEAGRQYLVSATDGQVNYCGFSGEATPELQAGFETAFAG